MMVVRKTMSFLSLAYLLHLERLVEFMEVTSRNGDTVERIYKPSSALSYMLYCSESETKQRMIDQLTVEE